MKIFLIFFIICLLAVTTIFARPNDDKLNQALIDCAEEFNIDGEIKFYDSYTDSLTEDEHTCLGVCLSRKFIVDDLIGSSNKMTFFNAFMKIIDEAYKGGFKNSHFTREDVVKDVENCYANERTECKFFKCIVTRMDSFNQLEAYFMNDLKMGDRLFNQN